MRGELKMEYWKVLYKGHFSEFRSLFLEHGTIKRLQKGEPLPFDEFKNSLYYVLDGVIRSGYVYENGAEKITGFFGEGQIIPYISALPITSEYIIPKRSLQSKCITDVSVVRLNKNTYYRLCDENRNLFVSTCNWIALRHNKYEYETMFLSNMSSFNKVCLFLYSNSNIFDAFSDEKLLLTQQEIGNIIGETRIEISRAFKKLREYNALETKRGGYLFLDKKKLGEILEENGVLSLL